MKTATVRDLRNHFPMVAAWIEAGEIVEITKSGKPFAQLAPSRGKKKNGKFKMPDIMARLDQTFGEKSYDSKELLRGIEVSRGDRS